jgi:predicted nucleic acid-binding protein
MTNGTTAPVVYVDANPFIYFIDGQPEVASRIRPFFTALTERPGIAITSELTLAEVLAKALPDERRNYFNLIVWSRLFQLEPVTRDILIDTADYRRVAATTRPDGTRTTIKLPDAIHVVTAMRSRCRLFFSADEGLILPAEMSVIRPDDAGMAELTKAIA